jgi:AraC-like DNA-binding protein
MMNDRALKITDACFAAGFNNLSNFNRQFLKHKAMTPSRFRALLADNFASGSGARQEPHHERAAS